MANFERVGGERRRQGGGEEEGKCGLERKSTACVGGAGGQSAQMPISYV